MQAMEIGPDGAEMHAKLLVRKAVVSQIEQEIDNLNEALVDEDGSRMMELVLMLDHLGRVKDYFEKGLECNEG